MQKKRKSIGQEKKKRRKRKREEGKKKEKICEENKVVSRTRKGEGVRTV